MSKCIVCGSKDHKKFMQVKDFSISKENFQLVECNVCSFVWTLDAPGAEDIGPYYQSEEYISHSDKKSTLRDRLYHLVRGYMLGRKFRIAKRFDKGSAGHLLDYGTGTGYFSSYVQNKGWTVTGVEINAEARSFARNKFGLDVLPIESLEKVDSNSKDVVTMWHVLEHIHNPSTLLSTFNRVLKESGHLIIAVPNRLSHDAVHYGDFWAAYDVPRHLWHFSPVNMKQLVEARGFTLEAQIGMPLDAYYVSLLSEQYKGNSLGFFRGILRGLLFNLFSIGQAEKKSSVIYVFKKLP